MSEQYLSDFMAKNNLDMVEIGSLFEDKMALILLPTESSGKPQWLYLAVIKKSPAEVSPIIDDAEKNLKQNYNLISDVYRQIEITQIKPLDEDSIGVFFAQPGNLFILSNDNQTIKNTIDKALK